MGFRDLQGAKDRAKQGAELRDLKTASETCATCGTCGTIVRSRARKCGVSGHNCKFGVLSKVRNLQLLFVDGIAESRG